MPAVVGLHNASALIPPGAMVAVDGSTGEVIVDPDAETLDAGRRAAGAGARPTSSRSTSSATCRRSPRTASTIRLEANIEIPDDAARALERGAEGIGLFRSEFLLAGAGQAALDRGGAVRGLPPADRERWRRGA